MNVLTLGFYTDVIDASYIVSQEIVKAKILWT